MSDPGPPAGSLAGKTVGIRFDDTWRSFLYATAEWAPRLEAAGARVRWWKAGDRVGEEGERTRRELEEFASGVDVAIVGWEIEAPVPPGPSTTQSRRSSEVGRRSPS